MPSCYLGYCYHGKQPQQHILIFLFDFSFSEINKGARYNSYLRKTENYLFNKGFIWISRKHLESYKFACPYYSAKLWIYQLNLLRWDNFCCKVHPILSYPEGGGGQCHRLPRPLHAPLSIPRFCSIDRINFFEFFFEQLGNDDFHFYA